MTDLPLVPFNKPYLSGQEPAYILDAVSRGHTSGDGHYTHRCHDLLRAVTGSPAALLTTSCTHALEMAALLLDLQPGDEVILPSFTFVSTANAFTLRGAKPVFADIRPDTLNIDEKLLPELITGRTRAIVVVHYAGVACEMDEILAIARVHDLTVIEDNAHGLGGTYRTRPLGTFGQMSTLSFHETKNIQCGEGGALLLNDESLHQRAEIIREKGTNRSQFFRGLVDKYTWVGQGSSYLPSDLLAAYLTAQLESFADIQARRKAIWTRYDRELRTWALGQGVDVPHVPEHVEQPAHLYYLLLPGLVKRTELLSHLRERGILAVFHYVPLHSSPEGQRLAPRSRCDVATSVSERIVRLPLFPSLTEGEQDRVLEAVLSFSV